MTDYQIEVLRGENAKALLENPLLIEAFDALEKEVIGTWKNSPARDQEGRESLWLMLHLSQKVRTYLETLVQSGTMAKISLKELEKKSLLERSGLI